MPRKITEGFTVGADPELFIHNEKNELVSAEGLIPGTKTDPYKVKGGAIQVDGMAAEINIDPVDNWPDFSNNIDIVLYQLKEMLPSGFGFVVKPSVHFSQEVMDAQPEHAKELGCNPDFNAWTGEMNPKPDTSPDPLMRTASGHIHIGWGTDLDISDEKHLSHCRDLVKQLDWYLGGWSLRVDGDMTRRKLYGQAGAFRPKPYGVEYRVLSNFWIMSQERRAMVWDRLCDAIFQMRKFFLPEIRKDVNNLLIEFINTGVRPKDLKHIKYPFATTDPYVMELQLPKILKKAA